METRAETNFYNRKDKVIEFKNLEDNGFVPEKDKSFEIEVKQAVKVYRNLRMEEKKRLLILLINTFDENSLKNLNTLFESLKHNDFKFRTQMKTTKKKKENHPDKALLEKTLDYERLLLRLPLDEEFRMRTSTITDMRKSSKLPESRKTSMTATESGKTSTVPELLTKAKASIIMTDSRKPSITPNLRKMSMNNSFRKISFLSNMRQNSLIEPDSNLESSSRQNSRLSRLSRNGRRTSRTLNRSQLDLNTMDKCHSLDLDQFIWKKNLDKLNDKSWESVKMGLQSFRKRADKSFDKQRTQNLIEKIKIFFRNSYERKEKSNNVEPEAHKDENNPIDDLVLDLDMKLTVANKRARLNKSVYLKKLKNNYYDKKLWESLLLGSADFTSSSEFNLYAENSARDYDNNEFSILRSYINNQSTSVQIKLKALSTISNSLKFTNATENSDNNSLLRIYTKPTLETEIAEKIANQRNQRLNEILNWIQSTAKWQVSRKHYLLTNLLEQEESEKVLNFLLQIIENKVKCISTNINHLPDHVLLRIFSHMDDKSLEVAGDVCKRWNFLAKTTELWLFKCLKLGTDENLGQIESILIEEKFENEDIDWKLAYYELKEFINQLKLRFLQNMNQHFATQVVDVNEPKKQKFDSSPPRTSQSQSSRKSNLNQNNSYINFYSDKSREKSRIQSTKEPLNESAEKKLDTITEKISVMQNVDSKLEITSSHNNSTSQSNYKSLKNDEKKYENLVKPNFKEIKMDLTQSKDILNKVVPSYRLRWQLENETRYDLKANEKILITLSPIDKITHINDHGMTVTCIDYDQKRLVTGGLDRLIYVYDVKDYRKLGKLEGHKGGVRCLQILANRLCSGSWDCTVIVWNMLKFESVVSICQNTDSVSCLYFDLKKLIIGSHDQTISVWTFNASYMETFSSYKHEIGDVVRLDRVIRHHKSPLTSLSYDGINSIISADCQGFIFVCDLNGKLIAQLIGVMLEPITCLKLVGSLILTSTTSGKVMFWNRYNNKCEAIIKCHESQINSIYFNDQRFYTAGSDGLIKEWDLFTFTCLRKLRAHEGQVMNLAVLDDKIFSCGSDKVIAWNFKPRMKIFNKK